MYDRHIIIDLEFTPVSRRYPEIREYMRDEIIQIGAVMLDSEYRFIGSFSSYVKPRYVEKIVPKVVKLTGINDEDLVNAPDLEETLDRLVAWIGDIGRVRVCSWSDTDLWQLDTECWVKGLNFPVCMSRWMDFQKVFCRIVGSNRQISLKDAVSCADVRFRGAAHSALWDAMATAELLRMTATDRAFAKSCRSLREKFTLVQSGSTIGELVGLQLADLVA